MLQKSYIGRALTGFQVRTLRCGVANPLVWSCYINFSVFYSMQKQQISYEMNNSNDLKFT